MATQSQPWFLIAVLIAVLTLLALPVLGYPVSLLRLSPDVNYALRLLACVTLLLGFTKLAAIAVVLVRARKAPH
jgi:hypothetical protein